MPYITPPKPILKAQDTVTLKEEEELWKGGTAFFLNARAPADYAAGHIAGGLSLPVEEFDDHYLQIAPLLTPDGPSLRRQQYPVSGRFTLLLGHRHEGHEHNPRDRGHEAGV
jgi:hypothetical protein